MKVLIAEDEIISHRLLQNFLEKWGYEVVVAQNGAEGWDLFEKGNFPIVLTDWMMPEMDGLELVRRIRACQRPGYVYIILLTAKFLREDVVEGMEAGADDFVSKPFDREELRVRVRAGERIIRLDQTLAEQNRTLRETQAALVQSEKLASLGQLAAGMAHEINNPIAYVTNNLAVLRRDVLSAMKVLDKYREGSAGLVNLVAEAARMEEEMDLAYFQENLPRLFETSLAGLQRVRDIVKNLRDFARLDEADFKEVDLNAALESTLEMIRHEVKEKEIQVQTRLGELSPVMCHPGKINQVFLNLLMNAVQACEHGGLIEVRSRNEPPSPKLGEGKGGGVVVEIEDNGCGIKPEHLPRIFEPFFTTKPVGQGMGLGLSISYGTIRDHGGRIEAESTIGRGTTFRVRLPVQPPK